METNVTKVLKQRGSIYGSYNKGVECRAQILAALKDLYAATHKRQDMPEDMQVMYSDIILKLMRSATAPEHLDSWVDLAGYTKLIKDYYEKYKKAV